MTTRRVFKFVVTLALVFAVGGAYGVFITAKANTSSAISVLGSGKIIQPGVFSANLTLKKARFGQGVSFAALPVGAFTMIDSTTLKCPGAVGTTCTYIAHNWQQIGASAPSNWAIATMVDSTFIGAGPFLGPVGTDLTANSWSDSAGGFSIGPHTVQTFVYMRDQPATAFYYSFEYGVYKP